MNPATIDPFNLPCLPLIKRKQLPTFPGIYFVMENESRSVLYIGKAVNLQQRWTTHHRLYEFKKIADSVYIAWLECNDVNLLLNIEEALIRHFKPPFNGTIVGSVNKFHKTTIAQSKANPESGVYLLNQPIEQFQPSQEKKRVAKTLKTPKGQYNQKKVSVNICITPDATFGLDAIAQSLKVSRSELIEQIGRGLLKVVKSDRP